MTQALSILLETWGQLDPKRPVCDEPIGIVSEVTEAIENKGWKLKTELKRGTYHVALITPIADGLTEAAVFKCEEAKLAEFLLSAYLHLLKRDQGRQLEQRIVEVQNRLHHYLDRLEQSHRLHGDTTMRLAQAIKLLESKGIRFKPESIVADELVG